MPRSVRASPISAPNLVRASIASRRVACVVVSLVALAVALAWPSRAALARQDPPASPAPRTLGFEADPIGARGDAFFVPMPGWTAELVQDQPSSGTRCARLARAADAKPESVVGNLMGFVDAAPYRGKRVALTSKVRLAGDPAAGGQAQMWFRVDRPGQQMGAFDNMGDRPIRAHTWTQAAIEEDVASDAVNLAIGWLCLEGAMALDVDDVELRVIGDAVPVQAATPPRALSPRELENVVAAARLLSLVRFFHPSDQAVGVDQWDRVAIDLIEQAEPARDAADLAKRLGDAMAELAPTVEIWAGTLEQAPPQPPVPGEATSMKSWRHRGAGRLRGLAGGGAYTSVVESTAAATPVDAAATAEAFALRSLGGGVSCRIPLKVPADAKGTLPHGSTPPELAPGPPAMQLTLLNRSTRLAAVALAWGVFEHFYPYFDVTEVDWDDVLERSLAKAATDVDEMAALTTLREMVAALRDGHGGVHLASSQPRTMLPLALRWCGDELVVVGRVNPAPEQIRLGDVVISLDGRSSAELLEEASRTISAATDGWRKRGAASRIVHELATGDPATLRLRRPDGTEYDTAVPRVPGTSVPITAEHRPANGSEVAPGIVYFDLNGTDVPALEQAMPQLLAAKGIVFDLRGYPNDAAYRVLEHLIDEPAQSAHWIIPLVTQPDREGLTWFSAGRWDMRPRQPHLGVPVAFLTDGRAISYAESIMGIVEAYRLGEIVGETTAGTNGNVNPFTLPGGASVSWTGMKVLKHDGSQHHGVGIAPTVRVVPTPQGIAAGRDEVLERAVDVVRKRIEG